MKTLQTILFLIFASPLLQAQEKGFYIQPVITAGITEPGKGNPHPYMFSINGTMLKGGINIGYTHGRRIFLFSGVHYSSYSYDGAYSRILKNPSQYSYNRIMYTQKLEFIDIPLAARLEFGPLDARVGMYAEAGGIAGILIKARFQSYVHQGDRSLGAPGNFDNPEYFKSLMIKAFCAFGLIHHVNEKVSMNFGWEFSVVPSNLMSAKGKREAETDLSTRIPVRSVKLGVQIRI